MLNPFQVYEAGGRERYVVRRLILRDSRDANGNLVQHFAPQQEALSRVRSDFAYPYDIPTRLEIIADLPARICLDEIALYNELVRIGAHKDSRIVILAKEGWNIGCNGK